MHLVESESEETYDRLYEYLTFIQNVQKLAEDMPDIDLDSLFLTFGDLPLEIYSLNLYSNLQKVPNFSFIDNRELLCFDYPLFSILIDILKSRGECCYLSGVPQGRGILLYKHTNLAIISNYKQVPYESFIVSPDQVITEPSFSFRYKNLDIKVPSLRDLFLIYVNKTNKEDFDHFPLDKEKKILFAIKLLYEYNIDIPPLFNYISYLYRGENYSNFDSKLFMLYMLMQRYVGYKVIDLNYMPNYSQIKDFNTRLITFMGSFMSKKTLRNLNIR